MFVMHRIFYLNQFSPCQCSQCLSLCFTAATFKGDLRSLCNSLLLNFVLTPPVDSASPPLTHCLSLSPFRRSHWLHESQEHLVRDGQMFCCGCSLQRAHTRPTCRPIKPFSDALSQMLRHPSFSLHPAA